MKKVIKKIIPYQVYNALKYNPIRLKKKIKAWESENCGFCERAIEEEHENHPRVLWNRPYAQEIFLLNTPNHKNLGDLAIAEAEISFLNRSPPKKQIIEVSGISNNIGGPYALKKIIPESAVILAHGGGYIGTDWPHEGETFRKIVMLFPRNRIILMPQSMFFSDDSNGRAMLKHFVKELSHHRDLHLIAREASSYELMKRHYKNANIYLCPDMVLDMDYNAKDVERKGILLCMRSDRERLIADADTDYIEKVCAGYGQVEYTDTFAPDEYSGPINAQTRGALVDAKLEQFAGAELIVTDRLHGMVFAAITGTPCVALSNRNHKIKGTAEWIKDLGYVRYIDDVKEISEATEAVLTHGPGHFDKEKFSPFYEVIVKLVKAENI